MFFRGHRSYPSAVGNSCLKKNTRFFANRSHPPATNSFWATRKPPCAARWHSRMLGQRFYGASGGARNTYCCATLRPICDSRARRSARYVTPRCDTLPDMSHQAATLCPICHTRPRLSAQYAPGRDTLPNMSHQAATLCPISHTRLRHSAQYVTVGRDTLPNMPHQCATLRPICDSRARHSAQHVTSGCDTLPNMLHQAANTPKGLIGASVCGKINPRTQIGT